MQTLVRKLAIFIMLLMMPTLVNGAEPIEQRAIVGDVYSISLQYENTSESDGGSNSSSRGRQAIVETVIAVDEAGIVLGYDLPASMSDEDRAQYWQYPARIRRDHSGNNQLLDVEVLEDRIDEWLERFEFPRAACGHWMFTWNAFQIVCDPQSVLRNVAQYDLRPTDLRDDGLFFDPMALEPGRFVQSSIESGDFQFVVEMSVDPEKIRHERVQADLITAQIMNRELTDEAARNARAAEEITGSIRVAFQTDADGQIYRKTRVVSLETRLADGSVEISTSSQELSRELIRSSGL